MSNPDQVSLWAATAGRDGATEGLNEEAVEYQLSSLADLMVLDSRMADVVFGDLSGGPLSLGTEEEGFLRKDMLEGRALDQALKEAARLCRGTLYMFCNADQVSPVNRFLEVNRWVSVRHCLVHQIVEDSKGREEKPLQNFVFARRKSVAYHGHCVSSVFQVNVGSDEGLAGFWARLLRLSSCEGQVVMDVLGSSSELRGVAKATNRRFAGIRWS